MSYVRHGLNNPVKYNDPTGHDPWLVRQAQANAKTYGVPWQVVAGLQDAEIGLDTQPKDYLETFFWMAAVPVSRIGPQPLRDTARVAISGVLLYQRPNGPGPGVGNIHLTTARAVNDYYAANYANDPAMQLGLGSLADDELAFVLSLPNVSTRVMAAYARMLADYRFGSGGAPSLTDHGDVAQWTVTDAVAIWHGYRYGVEMISPGAEGFEMDVFQNRSLDLDMMISAAGGTGKEESMWGSVPYFESYFGR